MYIIYTIDDDDDDDNNNNNNNSSSSNNNNNNSIICTINMNFEFQKNSNYSKFYH